MADFVNVTVNEGTLRGRRVLSATGSTYCSFQGVPYARPPVGRLRFQIAQPPETWSGVRDALVEGSSCTQFNLFTGEFMGEEDCLYLNVYTPKLPEDGATAMPVMVWIHGGGYTSGSGDTNMYGPDYMMENGIVLVTINYRLGILGFLNLDIPTAPSNVGLKDQVAALRWVNANIAHFGGSTDSITIFGTSAGGASVHMHMLSPMSKGLFHKAIAQSGAAINPWGFHQQARERAFDLGAALSCATDDPYVLADYLRDMDDMQLIKAVTHYSSSLKEQQPMLKFLFVPSVEVGEGANGEQVFLPADPLSLIESGHHHAVPYITGVNLNEGMLLTKYYDFNNLEFLQKIEQHFDEIVQPEITAHQKCRNPADFVAKLKKFVLKGKPVTVESKSAILEMYSDLLFGEGIHITVKKMAESMKSPVYYYCFAYDGKLNAWKKLRELDSPGVSHADELGYLFSMTSVGSDVDPKSLDAHVRTQMVKMWTNFAKTGNPTPDPKDQLLPVMWPAYTLAKPCYLHIDKEFSIRTNLFEERMKVWEELYHNA